MPATTVHDTTAIKIGIAGGLGGTLELPLQTNFKRLSAFPGLVSRYGTVLS